MVRTISCLKCTQMALSICVVEKNSWVNELPYKSTMYHMNISAALWLGQFSGRFLTGMGSRQPMLNHCSAQTEAWGDTCKSVYWLSTVPYAGEEVSALTLAELPSGHCSASQPEDFPVVPWLRPNDTDERAQDTLGLLLGLTALRQDEQVLEDRQVGMLLLKMVTWEK